MKESYNIDELLAELRAKRSEIENPAAKPASGETSPSGDTEQRLFARFEGDAETSRPEQRETRSKAEEIRRMVQQETAPLPQPQQPQPAPQPEKAASSAPRSIRERLSSLLENEVDAEDPVFRLGHDNGPALEEPDETPEQQMRQQQAVKHPVFTAEATTTYAIPAEQPKASAGVTGETIRFATTELNVAAQTRGILNVKENVDDSFREFFGDTVLVEHEDQKQTRRVREASAFEEEQPEHPEEYRTEEDTEDVLQDLLSARGKALGRMIGTAAVTLVLLAISALSGASFLQLSGRAYYGVHAALLAAASLLNAGVVFGGTLRLFLLRADLTSLCGFSALLGIAQCVVLLLTDAAAAPLCAFVSALALLGAAVGDFLNSSRILKNFRAIAQNPKKYASQVLADQAFTRSLTGGLHIGEANVLIKRRTGFTDHFLAHSGSTNVRFDRFRKLQPLFALLAAALGVITVVRGGSAADGFSNAAFAAAMCAPVAAGLVSALPLHCLQSRLTRLGAVLPGYSAAEELAGANCVVLEGRELFPREKVLLYGIKSFEQGRADRAILYAASVLIHGCDTMSHMFMKVIQGKTDMLPQADSVVYEEGLGFSFWVDQNRILVGSRELLEAHEIEVPSRDYENRYTKSSTRDAIYLAVSGKLYAMFVIGYAPDEEMASMLQDLVKQGINIIVRTRDFIISPDKISRMYEIPRSMVTLVRDSGMQELAHKTEYTQHCASSLTHIGSASCVLQGAVGSHRLLAAAAQTAMLACLAMALGGAIALVLSLLGALTGVSLLSVSAFQLGWTLLLVLSLCLRRF